MVSFHKMVINGIPYQPIEDAYLSNRGAPAVPVWVLRAYRLSDAPDGLGYYPLYDLIYDGTIDADDVDWESPNAIDPSGGLHNQYGYNPDLDKIS